MDLKAGRTDLRAEKRALRDEMRSRRRAVSPEETARAGARVAELLDQHLGAAGPRAALLYASLPGELDTAPLDAMLRRRGIPVAYPRVVDASSASPTLALHLAAISELHAGRSAIREPLPSAPSLAPDRIDLAVIPGLAFDRQGHRLGFGRGFYDALLTVASQAVRYGVCLTAFLLDRVPVEPHDAPVDFILTDVLYPTGARNPTPCPFKKEVTP